MIGTWHIVIPLPSKELIVHACTSPTTKKQNRTKNYQMLTGNCYVPGATARAHTCIRSHLEKAETE